MRHVSLGLRFVMNNERPTKPWSNLLWYTRRPSGTKGTITLVFEGAHFARPFKLPDRIFTNHPDVQLAAYLYGGKDGQKLEFNRTRIIHDFDPDFEGEMLKLNFKWVAQIDLHLQKSPVEANSDTPLCPVAGMGPSFSRSMPISTTQEAFPGEWQASLENWEHWSWRTSWANYWRRHLTGGPMPRFAGLSRSIEHPWVDTWHQSVETSQNSKEDSNEGQKWLRLAKENIAGGVCDCDFPDLPLDEQIAFNAL